MIPKVIHYCWFGGNELPERDKKCIESWKKFCPDYEIKEWNESNYDVTKNKYMYDAYQQRRLGFVPDYARLDIIYSEGGIYLDTDVELLQSFDSILDSCGFAGFESSESSKKVIALGLGFGAEKNNEIIRKMRDDYDQRDFVVFGKVDLTPSPGINTKVLKSLGLSENGEFQTISGFNFYPEEYFCPISCVTNVSRITNKTISIHHYNASWLTDNDRKRLNYINTSKKIFGAELGSFLGKVFYYVKVEGLHSSINFLSRKIRLINSKKV